MQEQRLPRALEPSKSTVGCAWRNIALDLRKEPGLSNLLFPLPQACVTSVS